MSSNLPLVRQIRRVLLFLLYGQGGHKLEINIPPQQIYANSKGGVYNRRGRNVAHSKNLLGVHFLAVIIGKRILIYIEY